MTALSEFAITTRWPASHPDRIQLYSFPTPNGVKISVALEELGLPYEAHLVDISQGDQKSEAFESLNPNGRIPALIDPNGPAGKPVGVFESGAILTYLAEKTGKLLPSDAGQKYQCLSWLHFQMGGIGPMFGQFGHFYKFAADKITDPYPTHRYRDESKRLLGVLEARLEGRQWIMDDEYSIADIAIFPWIWGPKIVYDAADELALDSFTNVNRWFEQCMSRPASEKGLSVPPRP